VRYDRQVAVTQDPVRGQIAIALLLVIVAIVAVRLAATNVSRADRARSTTFY
jgi:hypothetical protein